MVTNAKLLGTVFDLNRDFFTARGFVAVKKTFEFIRTDPAGYEKVALSAAKVGTRFYLTYGLLIRIDALQQLVHPFTGSAEIHQRDGASITTSAISLKNDLHHRQYIVDTPADIVETNHEFLQIMQERGIAWLEKYRGNIAALDRDLNGDEIQRPEYLQLLMKPLYGIAAAHLSNNPGYDEVVLKHRRFWEAKVHEHAEFDRNLGRIDRLVACIASLAR